MSESRLFLSYCPDNVTSIPKFILLHKMAISPPDIISVCQPGRRKKKGKHIPVEMCLQMSRGHFPEGVHSTSDYVPWARGRMGHMTNDDHI